jgi:hypothetical protein
LAIDGVASAQQLLRSRARRIATAEGKLDLTAIAQPILDEMDVAEAKCRSGADISVDLDTLTERVNRFSAVATIERAFQALPAAAQGILGRLRHPFAPRQAMQRLPPKRFENRVRR